MSSTSEKGHATIVANFEKLISFVRTFGSTYNPSKSRLHLANLESMLLVANDTLSNIIDNTTMYNNKVSDRKISFAPLKSLASRLVNALELTDANEEVIADAKGFKRKIQGKRAKALPIATMDATDTKPNKHSISQQSYVYKVQHFASLLSILQNESSYAPNETELQIAHLESMRRELALRNSEVHTAFSLITQARNQRNEILYTNIESICDIAAEVKKYIKIAYGMKSNQYNNIKSLSFPKRYA